jgi:hypothetical protein
MRHIAIDYLRRARAGKRGGGAVLPLASDLPDGSDGSAIDVIALDEALTGLETCSIPPLRPDYEPKGWNPPGVTRRAVPGHELGLSLTAEDKAALLAFLRSL